MGTDPVHYNVTIGLESESELCNRIRVSSVNKATTQTLQV